MKALVTGGAGFIGHHLVRALLERGDGVVVLDDFSTGFRERLTPYADRARVIEGSILDPDRLSEAMAGCEVVFHEAALASVERSFARPGPTNEVNVEGTVQVVLAAGRQGVRRVVFAASSSVYGVPVELPCREAMKPSPASPYGISKLAGEYYLHTIGGHVGVETVALRYFNVFGPGQDPDSHYSAVIPLFITAVLDGRRPTVNGDGGVTRDFTYVENVVTANLLAATAAEASGQDDERRLWRPDVAAGAAGCHLRGRRAIGGAGLRAAASRGHHALPGRRLPGSLPPGLPRGRALPRGHRADGRVVQDAHASGHGQLGRVTRISGRGRSQDRSSA